MGNELRDVVELRVIQDYRLYLRFDDGKSGEIDLAKFIVFEGIFAPLKNPQYFASVFLDPELGTICWENGADISPEFLYEHIT